MKKSMRKLIPAFAMLLVSAVMMSTASFAWFSMNTEVKATGMKVTAKSDASLAIAKQDVAAQYAAEITYESTSLTKPSPCAPKVTSTYSDDGFFKLTEAGIAKVNATDGKFNNDTATYSADNADFTDAVKGTDFIHETFYIKGSEVMNVTAKATISANTKEITKALHIAVVYDNTTVLSEKDVDANTEIDFGTIALTADTAMQIDVYIWYDGNDSNCDNAAAAVAEESTINFIFTKQN